jgi:hypothetical protein
MQQQSASGAAHYPGSRELQAHNCALYFHLVCRIPVHQRSPAPQPSALLQCLSQLNADTWAQVLLPKLVEQGSAADVALTCSQLRDLCYSIRRSINLGALLDSSEPSRLKSVVSGLPVRYPDCSAVSLQLKSVKSYHMTPYVLPALAR